MKIEMINRTTYANIYGVYEPDGTPAGTVEVKLAGRDVGTYFYTLSRKHTRAEIRQAWKDRNKI